LESPAYCAWKIGILKGPGVAAFEKSCQPIETDLQSLQKNSNSISLADVQVN